MDAGSSIRVRRSGGRRWVRAFFVALAIEALLNWASLFACADYSFSLKVTCLRVALMLGMFALYRVFRKDSRIWRVSLDLSRRPQFIAVCILITLMSAFLLGLSRISGQAEWLERGAVYEEGIQAVQDGNQYDYLADAFLAGGVELDLPRSDILLSMDNPYDTLLRQQLNAEAHEPIYWDYAFYQGKYYCYFGALPCLLAFVPYKAITGCDLRTDWAVVFFACAMLISGAALLYQLARTYYRDLSFGAFLVGVAFLFCSGGVLEQVFLPRIYSIPILAALFFSFAGACRAFARETAVFGRRAGEQAFPCFRCSACCLHAWVSSSICAGGCADCRDFLARNPRSALLLSCRVGEYACRYCSVSRRCCACVPL